MVVVEERRKHFARRSIISPDCIFSRADLRHVSSSESWTWCKWLFTGRRVAVMEGGFRGWERRRLPAGSLSLRGWKDAVLLQGVYARGMSQQASQHVAER